MRAVRKEYRDPETGIAYLSPAALKLATTARHERILREFASLVAEGNLGQDPWERLPGEPPAQYSRFLLYLKLGPDAPMLGPDGSPRKSIIQRSVGRVAYHLNVGRTTVAAQAKKWYWELRGDCWQRHLDAEELTQMAQDRRRALARQQRLGQRLQNLALRGLDQMAQDPDRMEALTATELTRLAATGVKIERLSATEPGGLADDPERKGGGGITVIWKGPIPEWAQPAIEGKVLPLDGDGGDQDAG